METFTEDQRNSELGKVKFSLASHKGGAFLMPILCSTPLVWSEVSKTACTDGSSIHFNKEFFDKIKHEERVFTLAHELWHIALMHVHRIEGRDPLLWNIAGDCVINNMLSESGYSVIKGTLLNKQFSGKTTEEIYDLLYEELGNNPKISIEIGGIGQDISDKKLGEEDGSIAGDSLSKTSFNENLQKVIASTNLANKIKSSLGNNIIPGNIMGEIGLFVDKFTKTIIPWQSLLSNFFNEISNAEYSYARPNRRNSSEFLTPSMVDNTGLDHIIYFLDISGSISDEEIFRFNSEVKHIKDTYNPKKITLITFDTVLHDFYEFDENTSFDSIKVNGRGGTSLKEVVSYANKHEANAVIIFTDLYVDIPITPIQRPVLWVVTNNENPKVPYGTIISIKDDSFVGIK